MLKVRMSFILFDGMTTLDFTGFHNAVTWLKRLQIMEDLTWDYCAVQNEITDDRSMMIKVNRVAPHLSEYDLVFIPGGMATRQLVHDSRFIEWIQTARDVKYKASVCTGALLWGAAGFTKDLKMTTNPLALDLLKPYCKEVIRTRAMRDRDLFTGGGITASIDLGLLFVEHITSREVANEIQTYMDYPYYREA
jgi:transcriptional regulator GlxA family with amidase domain